jgi:hypothetical protein
MFTLKAMVERLSCNLEDLLMVGFHIVVKSTESTAFKGLNKAAASLTFRFNRVFFAAKSYKE